MAKDLALITVNVIDKASKVYEKAKDISVSMSNDIVEKGDSKKSKKTNKN